MAKLTDAKRAGEIAEEIERINSYEASFKECRSIELAWRNENNNLQKTVTIGKPNLCWVNSGLYEDMHSGIIAAFDRRRRLLWDELRKLFGES